MPYIAIPTADFKATDAADLLPALLQAETAFVGREHGHVVCLTEYAPNPELWDACGLTRTHTAGSRDLIERALFHDEAAVEPGVTTEEDGEQTPPADADAPTPDEPPAENEASDTGEDTDEEA